MGCPPKVYFSSMSQLFACICFVVTCYYGYLSGVFSVYRFAFCLYMIASYIFVTNLGDNKKNKQVVMCFLESVICIVSHHPSGLSYTTPVVCSSTCHGGGLQWLVTRLPEVCISFVDDLQPTQRQAAVSFTAHIPSEGVIHLINYPILLEFCHEPS